MLALAFIEIVFVVGALGRAAIAAMCGMRVEAVVFGFGPPLWGRGRVRLAAIPLGAFCRIAGFDPTEAPVANDDPRAFQNKPLLLRLLVALGWPLGVQAAIIAYILGAALLLGVERPSGTVEITAIVAGSPAEAAGLRAGDEIVALDGRPVDSHTLRARLHEVGDRETTMEVRRGGETQTVRARARREGDRYLLGISIRPGLTVGRPGIVETLTFAARYPFVRQADIVKAWADVADGREKAEALGVVGMTAVVRDQRTAFQAASTMGLFGAYLVLVALLPVPPLPGARFWMVLFGWRGPRWRSPAAARDAGTVESPRPRIPAALAFALVLIAIYVAGSVYLAANDRHATSAIASLYLWLAVALALGRPRAWSVGVLLPVLCGRPVHPDPLILVVGLAITFVVFATLHLAPVRRYFGLACPVCARVAARPVPASRKTSCMACGSTWITRR
jgi:regulator of sigma E protease